MKDIIDYLYLGGAIVLIAGFCWMLLSMVKDMRRSKQANLKNIADHEIIEQQIKLADGKVVALEIRVKILEDTR